MGRVCWRVLTFVALPKCKHTLFQNKLAPVLDAEMSEALFSPASDLEAVKLLLLAVNCILDYKWCGSILF